MSNPRSYLQPAILAVLVWAAGALPLAVPANTSPDLPLHLPLPIPSTGNITFIQNGTIGSNTSAASNEVTILGNIAKGIQRVRDDPTLNLKGTTDPQSIYLDYNDHPTRDPYQRPHFMGLYMINTADGIKSAGWAHTAEVWGDWKVDDSFSPCAIPALAVSFQWSDVTLNYMDAAKLVEDKRREKGMLLWEWNRIICELDKFASGQISWVFVNTGGSRDRVTIPDGSVTLGRE